MSAPPPGPPWDLPLAEAPLAFVDLEMTGLDASRDRILEVCIDRVIGGRRARYLHTLVNPGGPVGGAVHVHGIGEIDVADAPPFAAIVDDVIAVLEGSILVAHAAVWDAGFLRSEAARASRSLVIEHWIDTLVLARRAFALHSYSLDSLCRDLGIERGRAHRADSDVRAMRVLFDKCVAALAPVSVRDLWEVRIGERHARAAVVDACEAAAQHGVPIRLTYRPSRRGPESLEMVVLEVRSDLDPPRIVGYQLPGRGRRELRADRILRIEPPLATGQP
jgi:DNA polymerase-3 subunit epsilon